MLMHMRLKQIHSYWPQASMCKRVSVCTTEHFNHDPKADLCNGLTQAHTVFTCVTAARPFVQTLSPSYKAGMLSAVTCDQTHHVSMCIGHLWIAPTVQIQQCPPGQSGGYFRQQRGFESVSQFNQLPYSDRTPLFLGLTRAFPFSVAALAATELQFSQQALNLRLWWVLQLLQLAQLHHGIEDHLSPTFPPLFSHPLQCRALCEVSGVSPAFAPQQRLTLVMLANKHTRNARLLSHPSKHADIGVPDQDALVRNPLWSMMMKAFPSGNGCRDPK
ncbi:hypothetical protein O181_035365 [Austropuccinia psidii MF-1]|uniref:Uncharacterized protein n=1 Tax=Austropuccinia psidii MF-1 TaxID=1389203 RepID=A0A9Q3D6R3_9BASI|nr:hypothetical protein [Austropuccinia psidii MF-1]